MGVAELRDAFNAVVQPQYTVQRAFLSYETAHDTHYQVISFSGIDAAGQPFTCRSDPLTREPNLQAEAAKLATAFLKSKA